MNIIAISFVLLGSTFYDNAAFGQGTLSLNAAVHEAESYNPELKRTKAAIDEADRKSVV